MIKELHLYVDHQHWSQSSASKRLTYNFNTEECVFYERLLSLFVYFFSLCALLMCYNKTSTVSSSTHWKCHVYLPTACLLLSNTLLHVPVRPRPWFLWLFYYQHAFGDSQKLLNVCWVGQNRLEFPLFSFCICETGHWFEMNVLPIYGQNTVIA